MITSRKQFKIIVSCAAAILWMLLIFYLSSQTSESSNSMSTGITEVIMNFVDRVVPEVEIELESFNHIVRKYAHFVAYLVLGVLVLNAHIISGRNEKRALLSTLVICVLYAISDEIHQAFVPGRGPQVKDVLIDSAGALVGIVIYFIPSKIKWERTKHTI